MPIYISGKISDLPTEEVHEKFHKATMNLKSIGFTIVNPLLLPHIHEKTWEAYMRECLIAMLKCDSIYLLKDWNESKGAIVEYELAKLLKLEVLYEQ